jgi:sugar lactone lactonase YvrE
MKHALVLLLVSAIAACGQVQYAFTNFAGMPGGGGNVDGSGNAARFRSPSGVAVDNAGNLFVADTSNETIRKITPDGVVTTLAGSAAYIGGDDGTGSAARFNFPYGATVDSGGNLFVADARSHTIRKITPTGVVTTLAGLTGNSGSDDGSGGVARFNYPTGVAVDSAGNVYVADKDNHTIRKITPAGAVTTLAGSAGEFGSEDGAGSAARFVYPTGVAVDAAGNLYVADRGNSTIRKITPAGAVTTLTDNTGSAARFGDPTGVTVDGAGNVYVAEKGNDTIRKITSAGVVTTLAGSAGQYGSANGTGSVARFSDPWGVAVDTEGNVYVADSGNDTFRKITPAAVVTTVAGSPPQLGSTDGAGSAARFFSPRQVTVDDAGNVYVADFGNSTIRKITPAGEVTTFAGSAGQYGSADGTGSAARFAIPWAVAADTAGNIYVADYGNHTIRRITADGEVTTLAGSAGQFGSTDGIGDAALFNFPSGVAVDGAGIVYVADKDSHTIRKITPAGAVTTLAGTAGQRGSADGSGSAARFGQLTSVALDDAGNLYVADTGNSTIRKVTPDGAVTTLAGTAGKSGSADGVGSAAQFGLPYGVAVDSAGILYVSDSSNNRITKGTRIASPPFQFVITADSLTISNGLFQTRLTGPSGSNVVVEASSNLPGWIPIQTNALPSSGLDLSMPVDKNQNQFFRARLAP